MRLTLITLLAIHALIHLMGFLKGFGLSQFEGIKQEVSRPMALLWLVGFLLMAFACVQVLMGSPRWFVTGFLAVVVSQVLIILFWSDARFGTIPNVIILVAAIMAYAAFDFQNMIRSEREQMITSIPEAPESIITESSIQHLPPIVQKWLTNTGTVGKQAVRQLSLTQELRMKMKPEQTAWTNATADQIFTIDTPAFNWSVEMQMNPFMPVTGRDKFEHGKGEMLIKLFSLFPIVKAKNNDKINQSALQRFLAEMVWFPSAALQPYITWEEMDAHSAKATMTYNGITGSGTFHFDENGRFEKFVAMRYKDVDVDAKPLPWTIIATRSEVINGITVPVELTVSWTLEEGEWTWLELSVKGMEHGAWGDGVMG